MIKKTAFSIPNFRIASLLAVSAMALGLAGCDQMKEPTVGEKLDSAIDKTQRLIADFAIVKPVVYRKHRCLEIKIRHPLKIQAALLNI